MFVFLQVQASFDYQELRSMQESNASRLSMQSEIERKSHEIQTLSNKVEQLESSLRTCEERAINLQEAVSFCPSLNPASLLVQLLIFFQPLIQVTLYSNSVSVLEATGEESKLQVSKNVEQFA